MNEHDAERIRALLEAEGLERADEPDDADVLVYNTCTVRKSADDRLAGHLGTAARLKREDPARVVLVTGCLPQAEQAGFFARFPFVDGALGPQNLHRLPELLQAAVEPAGAGPAGFFDDGPHFSGSLAARRERPFQAWVQVMSGCTNFCSYCIVPLRARPRAQPRRPTSSSPRPRRWSPTASARSRCSARTSTPTGSTCGAGERRARRASPRFCARLDAVAGLERIRFMTSHPKDLGDDLIAAVAELPSVCEHVHLPAQAGSDRVLAAMRRGYTAAQYLERVRALRAAVPDVSITTDLIAGFPGETEDDFEQTLDLVREARLRRGVHVRLLAAPGHRRGGPARTRCRPRCAGSAWSA